MQRDGDAVGRVDRGQRAVHVSPKTGQGVAGRSRVSLTAVARPREELARRAVALLPARIKGGVADERVQVMPEPRLVVRRSTAPFRLRRS